MNSETSNLYDRVISSVLSNIMIECKLDFDNQIVLRDFNADDPAHQLYYNCAMMASCLNENKPVYIAPQTEDENDFISWCKYIKLWWKKKQWRKQMRYMSSGEARFHKTVPVNDILECVRVSFQMSKKAFNKVNRELYGW